MNISKQTYSDYLPLETYVKYAESMSHDDEDLRQELFLAAWTTMHNGHTYPARVLHSMAMARIKYRSGKGKSIDNGNPWRRPKWGSLTPMRYDESELNDPALVSFCRTADNPEETALFNISFERFQVSLTTLEQRYVNLKLAGFMVNDAALGISRYMGTKIRHNIRQKFSDAMEASV